MPSSCWGELLQALILPLLSQADMPSIIIIVYLIVSDTICHKMLNLSFSGYMAYNLCLLFPKFDRFSVCNWNNHSNAFSVFFSPLISGFFPGIRILETFSVALTDSAIPLRHYKHALCM